MRSYVAGFLFNTLGTHVALIEKANPEWQKGMLNAIGGKIMCQVDGDTVTYIEQPLPAMIREFEEETGVFIPPGEWKYKVRLFKDSEFEVFFFAAFSDVLFEVSSPTAEKVGIYPVADVLSGEYAVVRGLNYLLPLCLDKNICGGIQIEEMV